VTEPPQPQVVQAQPTPQSWIVETHPPTHVVVMIASVTGQHVSFLKIDDAEKIGQQIVDAARRARSGLVIARGVQLPPLQAPNGGAGG